MANYHYPKASEDLWKKKIRQRRKQHVRRKLNLERTRRVFEYDPNPSMLVPADLLTPPNSEKKKPQDAQQQGFTENHELEDNGERPKLTLVRPEEDPDDLPYDHEKWDAHFRETNLQRTSDWIKKCKVYDTVGKGREEIGHTDTQPKSSKIDTKFHKHALAAENVIKDRLSLPEQYIVNRHVSELKNLEDRAVHEIRQYRDKVEELGIELDTKRKQYKTSKLAIREFYRNKILEGGCRAERMVLLGAQSKDNRTE